MPSESEDAKYERKKILFIFDSKFSEWKGTQRFFYEFGNFLVLHEYKVTLIENDRRSAEELMQVAVDLPFNVISLRLRKIFSIYLVPRRIIMDLNPDVIYVNSLNSFPIFPFLRFRIIFGMHVIHVSSFKYALLGQRLKFWIKKLLFSPIVKFIWKNKNIMIHALNTDQRDWIINITKNRFPVKVIGNPVDCEIDDNIAYLENMKKNERFTVLFFGSLSREKGFSGFLSILNFISSNHLLEGVSFIIAGGGKLKSEAEMISRNNSNITFIERPGEEQKRKIMLSSDLFVFPSINENFPITAVEAQSTGLPCLFSDITPLKNMIIEGKNGFCMPLSDGFENRFYEKIIRYRYLWASDYEKYREMRVEIAETTRRLCKENVLPQLLDMVESFLKTRELP